MASMEPLFFKAENISGFSGFGGYSGGFNGAAFFQSGKSERWRRDVTEWLASMEPLFFKAENMGLGRLCRLGPRRLQWSRFFSKRKMHLVAAGERSVGWLQWSRFFSSGNTIGTDAGSTVWLHGAAFFKRI